MVIHTWLVQMEKIFVVVVIGTSNNIVGILLNTGEYIDAPVSAVRRIRKLKK
jgi:hypothetical protein